MLPQIIKIIACLGILLAFYKLVLEKENMHQFKRYFLLSAVMIAIGFPYITFTNYVMPVEVVQPVIENIANTPFIPSGNEIEKPVDLSYLLWGVYTLVASIFLIKFIINITNIVKVIRKNTHQEEASHTVVLVQNSIVPHTFLKYIFINKTDFENGNIPQSVLLHEASHAKQKHSIDIIFVELLIVFFWFNPLLYWLKHLIKLNHEFLADQAVLHAGYQAKQYQQTLLTFSSNTYNNQLACAINYSSIKKRLIIMKTETSTSKKWIKTLLILPVLALLLFSFSKTEDVLLPNDSNELFTQQQKATQEQIAEYNTLAKKYNTMTEKNPVIRLKDINRLKYLYRIMSKKQKATAEPFPKYPAPPPSASLKKTENEKTGETIINGESHFYVTKNNKTKYYNKKGVEVTKNGVQTYATPPFGFTKGYIKIKGAIYYCEITNQGPKYYWKSGDEVLIDDKDFTADSYLYKTKDGGIKYYKGWKDTKNEKNTDPIISYFNGVKCDGNVLKLTKKEIENGIVSLEGQKLETFKIKFPGYPTSSIFGNKINKEAKAYLNNMNIGERIVIFNLNSGEKLKTTPIYIDIIK